MKKSLVIITILGVLSITFASEDELEEITKATKGKLDNLARQLRILTTSPQTRKEESDLGDDGVLPKVDIFIDDMTDSLKMIQNKIKDAGLDIVDVDLDSVCAGTKKLIHKTHDDIKQLTGGKDDPPKNKRLVKELLSSTEEGIDAVENTLLKFVQALKPVKGEIAQVVSIAKELHSAVTKAADTVKDAFASAT